MDTHVELLCTFFGLLFYIFASKHHHNIHKLYQMWLLPCDDPWTHSEICILACACALEKRSGMHCQAMLFTSSSPNLSKLTGSAIMTTPFSLKPGAWPLESPNFIHWRRILTFLLTLTCLRKNIHETEKMSYFHRGQGYPLLEEYIWAYNCDRKLNPPSCEWRQLSWCISHAVRSPPETSGVRARHQKDFFCKRWWTKYMQTFWNLPSTRWSPWWRIAHPQKRRWSSPQRGSA